MDGHVEDGESLRHAPVRPRFHGTARAMLPVLLKGLALTFATLGVYRFWYITEVRKFLWGCSEVDGDGVEYTGRGVELFIGFLIALAVLTPLSGLLFLIGLATGIVGQVVAQLVGMLGVLVLAQFALFRARRYRLTRTVWRGVRFNQTGSGLAYAGRSILWGLLTLLTMGLAFPFMRASLERYKMRNTWFGDQQGAFSGSGFRLLRRGFWLWLLAIACVAGPLVWAGLDYQADPEAAARLSVVHMIAPFSFLIAAITLPLYQAIEFRWWAEASSIGPATARSDLGLFAFLRVYLGYLGAVLVFSLIAGGVGAAIGSFAYGAGLLEPTEPTAATIGLWVLAVALYLLAGLVFAALWQLFGVRRIWSKSLESVEIRGLPRLMAAQSTAPDANAFGEGIADALDFGGV